MSDKTLKLNNLQDILIDEFIERINSGAATPSDLNAARQLLKDNGIHAAVSNNCLLYTSPSPRDGLLSRMPSSA